MLSDNETEWGKECNNRLDMHNDEESHKIKTSIYNRSLENHASTPPPPLVGGRKDILD